MGQALYLYPLWLRLWHWINALLFISLVLSGFSLHFVELPLPKLSFDNAIVVHNASGIMIAVMYVIYFVFNIMTGNWRHYVPRMRGLMKALIVQSKFYGSGIFKGEPHPYPATEKCKFNPLQQLTYMFVTMAGLPILIITGLLYLFPEFLPRELMDLGGMTMIATAHYLISILMTIFLLGHIYLATMGETPTAEIRKMTSGWVEEDGDD